MNTVSANCGLVPETFLWLECFVLCRDCYWSTSSPGPKPSSQRAQAGHETKTPPGGAVRLVRDFDSFPAMKPSTPHINDYSKYFRFESATVRRKPANRGNS